MHLRRITYGLLMLAIGLIAGCELPTQRMHGFEVHGIDVSHYQRHIDWEAVAAAGIHFSFIKASEGMTLTDSLFCSNWEEAKQAGIKRGAYHFFRPATPVHEQAMNFQAGVKLEPGDLPPVLDVEVLDGATRVQLVSSVLTWLYLAEIHYGVKPIIYTNLKFYNKYLAGHFEEYPLWIARYAPFQPSLSDKQPWHFWQYGNRGELSGIDGPVDFNVFRGSLGDLDSLCVRYRPVLSQAPPSKLP